MGFSLSRNWKVPFQILLTVKGLKNPAKILGKSPSVFSNNEGGGRKKKKVRMWSRRPERGLGIQTGSGGGGGKVKKKKKKKKKKKSGKHKGKNLRCRRITA